MSKPPSLPADAARNPRDPDSKSTINVSVIAIWLGIQIFCAGIWLFDIPLATGASGYPRPSTRLAIPIQFSALIIGSALLFPGLVRTWRAAGAAIAASLPFLASASYFAGLTAKEALPISTYWAFWLLGLHLIATGRNTAVARWVAPALVTLVLGGGLLKYWNVDAFPPPSPTTVAAFGPLVEGISHSADNVHVFWPISVIFLGCMLRLARWKRGYVTRTD